METSDRVFLDGLPLANATPSHAAVVRALAQDLTDLRKAYENDPEELLRAVDDLGVGPLLCHRVGARAGGSDWPPDILQQWRAQMHAESAIEALRSQELGRLYEAFARADMQPLLYKGAALRHLVYPTPFTRPSIDTDLLIEVDRFDKLRSILLEAGYAQSDFFRGFDVSDAAAFRKDWGQDLALYLDVHVSLDKKPALAPGLSFRELREAAEPVPAVSSHALAVGRLHGLFLAALHYFGHLPSGRKFIWLLDIYLLLRQASDRELAELERLAAAAKLRSVVRAAMTTVGRLFDEPRALAVLEEFDRSPGSEIASYYVEHKSRTASSDMIQTFRETSGWQAKLKYLLASSTPPQSFIRNRVKSGGRFSIFGGYLHLWRRGLIRLVSGAATHLRGLARRRQL